MTDKTVKMRVNVAGYTGKAVSLYCAYDAETDVLLIAKEGVYEAKPREGFLRVTNQDRDETYDAVFPEDETREAINAFFSLDAMNVLSLTDTMKRHDPKNRIERDGMDERGMRYKIDPSITNGQLAVLIACYYAKRQKNVASVAGFMEYVLHEI